ncbi:carbon-nitrogen hydrolase family protein [Verrucomicrobia bacterium]|nr:carbon-nitrogen hydrolase family protein [Verrucomicrobiota bacterium]
MKFIGRIKVIFIIINLIMLLPSNICFGENDGWTKHSPRLEIRPKFEYSNNTLTIKGNGIESPIGSWKKKFKIKGGEHYYFSVDQKTINIKNVRQSAVVRLFWIDSEGNKAERDEISYTPYRPGTIPRSEAEFLKTQTLTNDEWIKMSDVLKAPKKATDVVVELNLRWDGNGIIKWKNIEISQTSSPTPRVVKLASVHYRPNDGSTNDEKCKLFSPFIEDASKNNVDLIVLPETLTYYNSGRTYEQCAEPIPGPSTNYFAQLAKKHNIHLVVGLIESENNLIYNVAVLIGPKNGIIGKYRKVCLPRGEIEGGFTPGTDYPVFETDIGKIGMMICYDGFFPEVARNLSNNGAEIIAFPVWGCNPLLASARAAENHVYLVSSTYTDASVNWMISAIYGQDGIPIKEASSWGTLISVEVDLNKRLYWPGLGDFKSEINIHRPIQYANKDKLPRVNYITDGRIVITEGLENQWYEILVSSDLKKWNTLDHIFRSNEELQIYHDKKHNLFKDRFYLIKSLSN